MSIDATRWAWKQRGIGSSRKLVLLAIADRADENHVAYPSISRLESDTDMDRKTVMKAIADLESFGLIEAERSPGSVTRFRLVGVENRHPPVPKTGQVPVPKTGQVPVPKTGQVPKTGPVPNFPPTSTKNGTPTSTKNGTVNLPIEPTKNLPEEKIRPPTPKVPTRNKAKDDRFDRFWQAYPKKRSKNAAERAFSKINPDEQFLAEIIAGVERAKTSDHRFQDVNFTPFPASWLNAKGWMDELQTDPKPATSSAYGKKQGFRPRQADNTAAVIEAVERFNRRTGAGDGAVIDGVFCEVQ